MVPKVVDMDHKLKGNGSIPTNISSVWKRHKKKKKFFKSFSRKINGNLSWG